MSTVSRTLQCDWPDCDATMDVTGYTGSLSEWKRHELGYHLCPRHRHKSWEELEQVRRPAGIVINPHYLERHREHGESPEAEEASTQTDAQPAG